MSAMIVAQLTDIHGRRDNDALDRLERALIWIAGIEPDALVVTGDLIDEGFSDLYGEIASLFRMLPFPVRILPGNSDDAASMEAAFNSGRGTGRHASNAMHFVLELGGLRVVGVDATVRGSPGGDIVPHLGWLETALRQPGREASLLFMHHHLLPSGIAPIDAAICLGSDELAILLRGESIRPLAICCGHVHRPMSMVLSDVPVHVCGSICAANPLWFGGTRVPSVSEPPMIMIHRWYDGALVSSHVAV